jgi:hypothetical protein
MCVQILIKLPNNNFYENSFSGSVVVSWVHQTKRWTEGTIYTGILQGFKHPYMLMMSVGPNLHIKWAGKKLFSLENQFIIGLFDNTLFTDEVERNSKYSYNCKYILYYIPELFIAFRQNNGKIVASLFTI